MRTSGCILGGKNSINTMETGLLFLSLPEPTKEGDRGETEEGNTAQIAELSAQEVLQQFQADQKYPRCEANGTGSIQPHGHSENIETKHKYDSRSALSHGPGCGGCIACSKLSRVVRESP